MELLSYLTIFLSAFSATEPHWDVHWLLSEVSSPFTKKVSGRSNCLTLTLPQCSCSSARCCPLCGVDGRQQPVNETQDGSQVESITPDDIEKAKLELLGGETRKF